MATFACETCGLELSSKHALESHVLWVVSASRRPLTLVTSQIRPFRALSQCFQLWNGLFASPPCDQYSRAHTCGTRDSERADVLAKRMWKFIDILKPERVLIEYPSSSMLWKRDFMLARAGTTFVVDYCQYGTAYRKPTMLWSNRPLQGFSAKTCPGPG